MRLLRFEKIAMQMRSLSVLTLLLISACATQQTQDVSIDEQIETMKQIENVEENSASVFVKQDMGLLSLHERNEREALKNLQIELNEEQLRVPATEEELQKTLEAEAASDSKQVENASNVNEKLPAQEAAQETAAQEIEQFAVPAPTSKLEVLGKEEMSQELFDAEAVVVQKGDSLSALAQKHLGNKKAWARIWSINPNIQNPNVIEVGTKLYIPKNTDRSVASAQEAAAAPPAPQAPNPEIAATPAVPAEAPKAPEVEAKKIPDLAPIVEAKNNEAAPALAASPTPQAEKNEEIPALAAVVNNGGSSHTLDELLWEHIESKRVIKHKGKESLLQNTPARKISSVNDMGPDEEIKLAPATPKSLTRLISFAGLLLLMAVLAGFFFSKPKNQ